MKKINKVFSLFGPKKIQVKKIYPSNDLIEKLRLLAISKGTIEVKNMVFSPKGNFILYDDAILCIARFTKEATIEVLNLKGTRVALIGPEDKYASMLAFKNQAAHEKSTEFYKSSTSWSHSQRKAGK